MAGKDASSECGADMRNDSGSYRRYASSLGTLGGSLEVNPRGMFLTAMDGQSVRSLSLPRNCRKGSPSIPLDERLMTTLPKRANSLPRQSRRTHRNEAANKSRSRVQLIASRSNEHLRGVNSITNPAYSHEALYGQTNLLANNSLPYVYDQPASRSYTETSIDSYIDPNPSCSNTSIDSYIDRPSSRSTASTSIDPPSSRSCATTPDIDTYQPTAKTSTGFSVDMDTSSVEYDSPSPRYIYDHPPTNRGNINIR